MSEEQETLEAVKEAFGRFYGLVKRLRDPGGCPWDREQTPMSIRANLVEEAYECASSIEEGSDEELKEELGDLFLVAAMVIYMKEQESRFRLTEVLEGICAKLIRRHPHVFGNSKKETSREVLAQWDEIKAGEPNHQPRASALGRVPRTFPPLERAYLLQEKAAKVGFDWPSPEPVWDKLAEEIGELRQASSSADPRRVEQELGDLLFTVVNLGRLMKIDPSLALNATNQKFVTRFQEVERRLAARGLEPERAGLELMDSLWNRIKDEEGAQ